MKSSLNNKDSKYEDSRYEGVEYLLNTLDKAGISIDFDEKQCSSH